MPPVPRWKLGHDTKRHYHEKQPHSCPLNTCDRRLCPAVHGPVRPHTTWTQLRGRRKGLVIILARPQRAERSATAYLPLSSHTSRSSCCTGSARPLTSRAEPKASPVAPSSSLASARPWTAPDFLRKPARRARGVMSTPRSEPPPSYRPETADKVGGRGCVPKTHVKRQYFGSPGGLQFTAFPAPQFYLSCLCTSGL